MKKIAFVLFCALAGSASAAPIINSFGLSAPTSTITFDEFVFAQGTVVDAQYSSLGVTFTSGLRYTTQGPAAFPGISGNYLGNFSPLINPFSIFFSTDQTEVAFGYASNPQTTTFSAYLNGLLVESFSESTTFNDVTKGFYGFNSIVFDEIRITGNIALIDNIQSGNSIPEPASLALMGLGLAGLAAVRRRKTA